MTVEPQPPRARVLVAEKIAQDGLDLLKASGADVDERKGLSPEELVGIIGDYEAIVVRSETKVTAALLAAGKKLKVVARAGVGVDNVDVEAATKLGIIVVNSPSGNIRAAAEHTIALLMATARNIPDACASLKGGKWERGRLVGVEVKGKTLGIVGLGKVGLNVARMAAGLGMKVLAVDPYASPEIATQNNVTLCLSLKDLLPKADFLTLHTPLIASTKGLIGAAELAAMKKGSRILNVARGGMIDEAALLSALESGHIAGAGLDVFSTEPPHKDPTSPAATLTAHPRVVATPHLGASTIEAQDSVAVDVCEQITLILSGALPRAAVNAPIILPSEYATLQPFVRLLERMGQLYTQYFSGPAARQHTFDLVYEGEIAGLSNTTPLFASLVKGLTKGVSESGGGNVNIVNAALVARERGIVINEQHSRDPPTHTYSSLVTLRARPARAASQDRATAAHKSGATTPAAPGTADDQVIAGFVSDETPYIKRLGRFSTSFIPDGTLIICHNYDSPGKIGVVGSVLGRAGVNVNFMSVAPVTFGVRREEGGEEGGKREALMILGVDREVGGEVLEELGRGEGILSVGVVVL